MRLILKPVDVASTTKRKEGADDSGGINSSEGCIVGPTLPRAWRRLRKLVIRSQKHPNPGQSCWGLTLPGFMQARSSESRPGGLTWLNVVVLFELGGWDPAEFVEEAPVVEPVDPLQGGQLEGHRSGLGEGQAISLGRRLRHGVNTLPPLSLGLLGVQQM